MNKPVTTADAAAKFILTLQDENAGDLISNLKLQKLLYYAQGCHLAIYGEPLFGDIIFAWMHGPVVEDIYHLYKEHQGRAIPAPEGFDDSVLSEDTKEFIRDVYGVFGQFSAWKLRNMTHEEPPYKESQRSQGIITHDSLKKYFIDIVEK